MTDSFHRALRVPRGTHLRHLTLRPHASDGTTKKVTVHKGSQEVGHFLLSEKDRLSDFTWTLHHRQLFLKLKQPVHSSAPPKVHGLRGLVSAAATWVSWSYNWFLWILSLGTLLMTMAISKEPGAAKWAQLDACAPAFFGAATWEDWRQADVFHLLYDWLLVLLQERLLSPQGVHGASEAWYQLLWVAAITTLLLILSTTNLIWSVLKHLSSRGRRQQSVAMQHQHGQQPVQADAAPSVPVGINGLAGKLPSSGSTPSAAPDLIPATTAPSPTPDPEDASRQAQLLSMRRALEEAGVETVSRADAHFAHLHSENALLKVQISSLSAQLTAAQQGSLYFRGLFLSASRQRSAADHKAKSALQQAAARDLQAKTSTLPRESVETCTNSINKSSGTVRKDPSAVSSVDPSSETSASTAAAGSSTAASGSPTAAATATEAARDRALSAAHKLRLSAEMRVHELSSANASLQGRLQRVTADLEQAETKIDKHEIKFTQADKMRQRAQEDLSGVAAERNQLLHFVTNLLPEQAQLPTEAVQDTSTYKDVPKGDCFQQTSPSRWVATQDQIFTQTPAKHAPQASTKPPQTLKQTDKYDHQIPAVHAGQGQLQELQKELQLKQDMIKRQAADITDAAVKMSTHQGVVQQLQADLKARELAALLFHVRLVPTKGFKGDQFDIPHTARRLGEGGSATIYQETLCGELRATKYPKKGVKAVGALAHELCMHLRCAGPSTVSILSVGMDQIPRGPVLSANVICFSMEMATMSLKACIAQATGGFKGSNREGLVFSLDTIKLILTQITAAIQGVHRTHTLHGDVKPDNFLVFGHGNQINGVKITDFGLSQSLENGVHEVAPTADGTRGTPGWIAPEMYVQNLPLGQKHRSTVGTAADVYAAGWVFFEVLCGLSPLMFQEAKTDDSFAAGAAAVAPLDSKIPRQEVSLDLGDRSSTESSLGSISIPESSSIASADEDGDEEGQDSRSAGSSQSHQSKPGSVDTAALHGASADAEGILDAGCSPGQAMDELRPAEDVEMVHLYPEYLLSGTGIKLLQLCQAMWARDPDARPSCEDILKQLAEL